MDKFNTIESCEQEFEKLLVRFSKDEREKLKEACAFAKKGHSGQERDEGTPYFIHPLRMAAALIRDYEINDIDLPIAALCHDLVEDTEVSYRLIEEKFGSQVRNLVDELTRERASYESEEDKKVNKAKKFDWLINQASYNAKLVKCVDLLDNLRSWKYIPEGHKTEIKFPRWFNEAATYYIPLAERVSQKLVDDFNNVIEEYRVDERFSKFFH